MVVNGIEYEVQDGEYEGGTDLDKDTFDELQENIDGVFTGQESMGSIVVENIECKNLFDKNNPNIINAYFDTVTTHITSNANNKMLYIKCDANTTYTIQKMNTSVFSFGYIKENTILNSEVFNIIAGSASDSLTITTGSDATYLVCRYYQVNNDVTISERDVINSIQIEKGNIATQFVEHKEFNNDRLLKDLNINAGTNPISWNDAYAEDKILVYGIVNQASVPGKPKDSPKYGTLVSIQAHYKAQIYIPDYACDIGVFMRFGKEDWVKLAGTKIESNV